MTRKAIIAVLTLAAGGTAAAYVVSRSLVVEWSNRPDNLIVTVEDGHVQILATRLHSAKGDRFSGGGLPNRGFYFFPFDPPPYSRALVGFDLWAPTVLFASYPTLAFIRGPFRRWRRRRKGLCIKCRYNLTGNTSGVCPECGTEIKHP